MIQFQREASLTYKLDEIVVIDYITNPLFFSDLDPNKINEYSSLGIDTDFIKKYPTGTIIGRIISNTPWTQYKIFLPFFPHISIPIKSGEHAWVLNDNNSVGYWLSRKIGLSVSEDVNFTDEERVKFIDIAQTTLSTKFVAREEIPNLDMIRTESISREEFKGEPVPSFKTPSHATSLQGSNNTLVLLTHNNDIDAGHIDIVAGRGINSPPKSVTNSDNYDEVDKGPGITRTETEGDLSSTDLSRIIASMKFDADSYFSIDIEESKSGEDSVVVLKSNQVRIVAKTDLKIQVGEGHDKAGMIIKASGDIVFIPSENGFIKLGGEDAVGAVFATADSITERGIVVAPSILDTAGGLLAVPNMPATGVYSTKVLVSVAKLPI